MLAVHISDGVLSWPWQLLGLLAAACLLVWSARRITDVEIPRVALLTAAFFVASSIRVPAGPTSAHLLLGGLLGVLLGRRCVLAIAIGLLFQAVLLGHGGYGTLGINTVVIAIPALLSRGAYRHSQTLVPQPSFRFRDGMLAVVYILFKFVAVPVGIVAMLLDRYRRRRQPNREFETGFLIGSFSVLLTAGLNALVLVAGGVEDWRLVAVLVLAAHIPLALSEGFIVGGTFSFLRRVKPEMLD